MAKKKEVNNIVLSETHRTTLELHMERQKNSAHEIKSLDYQLRLVRSEVELLKATIKLKEAFIREVQRTVPDYKNKHKDLKEHEKEYLNDVKMELGIESDRWGYDPDTGEVIIPESEEDISEALN